MARNHQNSKINFICLFVLIFSPTFSLAQTLTATHSAGSYTPGSNLTVTNQIVYTGQLSVVGMVVDLPNGWTYNSKEGENMPPIGKQNDAGAEFLWTITPASPIDFTYTVNVPEGITGQQEISARVIYRRLGDLEQVAPPNPLTISQNISETLTATHRSDSYTPGSNLTVTNRIEYTGELSLLGMDFELPEGWEYFSTGGEDKPSAHQFDGNLLTCYWLGTEIPASPIIFLYTVNIPVGTTGQQQISAQVVYRRLGGELTETAQPNPLTISQNISETLAATHSAGSYTPGSNLTVTNRIEYTGQLSAIGMMNFELPEGWSYVSKGGEDVPSVGEQPDGTLDHCLWSVIPASPIIFTYTVKVPEGTTGQQ